MIASEGNGSSCIDASGTHPTAVRYVLQKRLLQVRNRQCSNLFYVGCFIRLACNGVTSERGIGTGRDEGVRSRVASKAAQVASVRSESNTDAPTLLHSSPASNALPTVLGGRDQIMSRGILCHILDRSREESERSSTLGTTICSATRPIELRLAKLSKQQAAADETMLINVHLHRTVCQFRLGSTITSSHL